MRMLLLSEVTGLLLPGKGGGGMAERCAEGKQAFALVC